MSINSSTEHFSIQFPHTTNFIKGSHPFTSRRTIREGGFMLQQQDLNEKHVIHIYGHGGAKFSLAFGNAYLANKMITMRQHPTQIHDVAVLGAGITGLLVALESLKSKYKVTIYAQKLPKFNEADHKKWIGSQEGLQFWYPSFYDNQDPVKHQFICKIAYRLFKECLQHKKYLSIKSIRCFISGPQMDSVSDVVSEFITKDIRKVILNFENGTEEEFICFQTFVIDTELFMEEIMTQLRLRKVSIVNKKFESLQDIAKLKQKSVYNCMGYGAKSIFGDKTVSSMVGHYVKFQLDKPAPENFVIWNSKQDQMDEDVVITVFGKTVQFGSSWAKDKQDMSIDEQKVRKICQRAEEFMASKSKPVNKL